MLRHHLSEIRKAKDQLDQAMCSLEAYGERPKAFFPDSPVHKAVTADHIVLDSPVRGRMCDVIERWSEAWIPPVMVGFPIFSYLFLSFPYVFTQCFAILQTFVRQIVVVRANPMPISRLKQAQQER